MDQPGVYFTLNAPFAKFIGLYSNTGEGGTQGVIADAKIGNAQLNFLNQQLAAAKAERAQGQGRALIIATHHPPFTGSPFHIPSPDMVQMIDKACAAAGIWPDLHLSGHSHLYERYTRTVNGKQIPYVVAGMGGFYNLPGLNGFMRVTVSAASITGEFVTVDPASGKTGTGDSFTLDLQAHTVSNSASAKKKTSSSGAAKSVNAAKTKAKGKTAAKSSAKAKPAKAKSKASAPAKTKKKKPVKSGGR
jgi:hypothetical protein